MQNTKNYGLKKPESTDFYNIDDFNENADIIDTELKELEDGKAEKTHTHTKEQVGLENVPNVTTNNQTPTYTMASSNTTLSSGEKLSTAFGKIAKAVNSLISHLSNKSNPHSVTKTQVGLGNVDNTSDANKPVSKAQQEVLTQQYEQLTGYTDQKVHNASEWELIGSATGVNGYVETDLNNYVEFIVLVNASTVGILQLHLIADVMKLGISYYSTGGYSHTSANGSATIAGGGTGVTLVSVYVNGVLYETASFSVYGRKRV